jgi:hypothetical protein
MSARNHTIEAPTRWLDDVTEDDRPLESRELLAYKIDHLTVTVEQGIETLSGKIDGLSDRVTALENWRSGVEAVFKKEAASAIGMRGWLALIVALIAAVASILATYAALS